MAGDFGRAGRRFVSVQERICRLALRLIVEETLFVLDVASAFAAGSKVRKEMYGTDTPSVASNLIGVSALAFPEQIVEITFRAVVDIPAAP